VFVILSEFFKPGSLEIALSCIRKVKVEAAMLYHCSICSKKEVAHIAV